MFDHAFDLVVDVEDQLAILWVFDAGCRCSFSFLEVLEKLLLRGYCIFFELGFEFVVSLFSDATDEGSSGRSELA